MSLQTNNIYEFEDFRLDFTEKTLKGGRGVIPLTPKVFETLLIFLENPGRLIEKDELMQKLWQDRFVEESNLTFNIKMLRKALGDNAGSPRFVETIPKHGYRFIAEVRRIAEDGEKGRRGDTERKTRLSADSSAPFLPVSASPRPRVTSTQTGAVVALAEWRHEVHTSGTEQADEHIAKLELVPAKPVIRRTPKYLALVAAGLVLGAIGLGYYFLYAARGGEAIDSVAVLPFVNATSDTNTDYLSEGISDSIINSLSRLPNLKVNSLNSVMRYKGKEVDPQTVGRELSVRAVLMGKVMRQGESLAISVELVDVRDNRRLWGEQYNTKLADILTVQTEIARQISDGLRLPLNGEEKKLLTKQYTENNDAYLLYSLGNYYYRQNTKEAFDKSIEAFEQAIEIDPNYGRAYVGLALTYQFMGSRGFRPASETEQKVEWAALKALQIDDTLADAHVFLGVHKFSNFDWSGAEIEIKRALELDPNSPLANSTYAYYLIGIGRVSDGLAFAIRGQELDPAPNPGELAFAYFMARQYDKSINLFQAAIERRPQNPYAHILLGEVFVAKGMFADGVAEMEKGIALDTALDKTPERWDRYPLLAYAYAAAGRRDDALKILDEQRGLAKTRFVSPYNFAIIYAALRDNDQAFDWLEKCIEQRTRIMSFHFKSRPLFDSLRSDPRYPELLRKMNLTP